VGSRFGADPHPDLFLAEEWDNVALDRRGSIRRAARPAYLDSADLRVDPKGCCSARATVPVAAAIPKSQRNRWFADSPLEGDGFELSVPRERGGRFELSLLFMSLSRASRNQRG